VLPFTAGTRHISWALVSFVAAAELSVSACTRHESPLATGVTLRIGAALPAEGPGRSGIRGLIDGLSTDSIVANGSDGRQSPRLASGWEWDDAHTTLRMTLRKDVVFHDGTQLTPEIAARSLRKSIATQPYTSFTSVVSVDPIAEDAIAIRLQRPDSFLVSDLGFTSVRIPDREEMGTGPFRIVNTTNHPTLTAFEKYYRGRPAIDRIEITSYPTQRKAWASMMRGDIDVLHDVTRDAVEFIQAERSVRTYSFPRAYYIPLVFNVQRGPLARPDVRQALSLAINKEAAVREGLRSRGRPAESPFWPEHWANNATYRAFNFDPELARSKLDAAGFPQRRRTAPEMPSRFEFTCLVFADDARFERLALVIQKQLFDIGVAMKLQPVTSRELASHISRGDFDAFIIELASVRSLSWVYYFWHSPKPGSLFDTGYRAADAVLERLRRATSDEETRDAVAEVLQVFRTDPPAVFIAWQEQSRAVSTKFVVPGEGERDVLGSVWQWQLGPITQQAAK
jgi:peptide/nickel transport system substrate-binding protein